MTMVLVESLNQVASYLKVQGGKINLKPDLQPTRVVQKNTTTGCLNIILQLLRESNTCKNLNLVGQNALEEAEIRQWIEYGILYASQGDYPNIISQVMTELNSVLSTRTYLVSHRLTIADVFLYYNLQAIMESLSPLDKENYLNVCRWFDNLQQSPTIRQSNKVIDFSTIYLANVVPARH